MVFPKFSPSEGADRIKYPMWSETDLTMKIAIGILKKKIFLMEEKCLFLH